MEKWHFSPNEKKYFLLKTCGLCFCSFGIVCFSKENPTQVEVEPPAEEGLYK
jgi:hypothetical protein